MAANRSTPCTCASPPRRESQWVAPHPRADRIRSEPLNSLLVSRSDQNGLPPTSVPTAAWTRVSVTASSRIGVVRTGSVGGLGSVEAVEPLRIQSADFRAGAFADVRKRAQMFGALRPLAVPVRVVAGEHDEVVAQYVDDAGQDRLLRLAVHEDVAGPHVLLRFALPAAFNPVAALFEMLVQAVNEERHPAHARLEEGHPQSGMPIENTAGDHRGHRRHLVERKADAVHLDVVGEAVD